MTILTVLATSGSIQADWELQTVDSATAFAAIAVDSAGTAHLCYFTPPMDHLSGTSGTLIKYANNASGFGIWTTQTVATLTHGCSGCDIAVATDGSVRIAYVTGHDLMYARNDSGAWTVETVVSGNVQWRCALALDSSNNPHIAFSRYREVTIGDVVRDNGSPFYITRTADGWSEQTLKYFIGEPEYEFNVGQWQDIAVGSGDQVYGTWRSTTVMMFMFPRDYSPPALTSVQAGLPGLANRFRIDAFGDFMAAGINIDERSVVLGRNTSNPTDEGSWYFNWESHELDNCGASYDDESKFHLGLAVDSEAGAHLVFYDAVDEDLKYIWQSASWTYGTPSHYPERTHPCFTELVDSGGDVGRSADIGVDAVGDPHIVYIDDTNHTVKYGKRFAFTGPQLRVQPSRWNYGYAYVWPTENRKEFTIMNPGTEDLVVTSIAVEDVTTYHEGYWILHPVWSLNLTDAQRPIGTLPATIPPGEYRTFRVFCSPDTYGVSRFGELTVESNWGNIVVSLKAFGLGGEPPSTSCGPVGTGTIIAMLTGLTALSVCSRRSRRMQGWL